MKFISHGGGNSYSRSILENCSTRIVSAVEERHQFRMLTQMLVPLVHQAAVSHRTRHLHHLRRPTSANSYSCSCSLTEITVITASIIRPVEIGSSVAWWALEFAEQWQVEITETVTGTKRIWADLLCPIENKESFITPLEWSRKPTEITRDVKGRKKRKGTLQYSSNNIIVDINSTLILGNLFLA